MPATLRLDQLSDAPPPLALTQASDTAMLTVVTSLNDKFDSTDKTFSEHITGLNEAADAMYSNATQSLQVGEVGAKWV